MFAFAYEVRRADEAVVDPVTRSRFLTTRYTTAAAFARSCDAAVAQVGSGSAPYVGVVAEAVAQDGQRDAPAVETAQPSSESEPETPPSEPEPTTKPATAQKEKPRPPKKPKATARPKTPRRSRTTTTSAASGT